MRRAILGGLLAAFGFLVMAGCGGDSSSSQPTHVSKEEIEKAMQKMKKLGPKAHE